MILKPRLFRKPRKGHWATKELVLFPLFNEGSGDKVFDLSGNGNNGNALNTLLWSAGKFGPCLEFDVSTIKSFKIDEDFSSTKWSIVFWAKPFGVSTNYYLTDGNGARSVIIGFQSGYWNLYSYPTGTPADTQIPATVNVWQQICFTTDGTNTQGYRDGKLVFDVVGVSSVPSDNYLYVGRRYNDTYRFDGLLDHMAIYNHSLSASKIAKLYRKPFCMFERDPIELWSAATLGAAPPVGMAGAMTTNTGYWGW